MWTHFRASPNELERTLVSLHHRDLLYLLKNAGMKSREDLTDILDDNALIAGILPFDTISFK
jgi:hypothetical protein